MKTKRFCASALLLALCVSLLCVSAHADDLWSEDYYRAYDFTNELNSAQVESLDKDCIAFMKQYKLDLALIAVTAEDYEGSLEEASADYYESCGFGYGAGHDGFFWVYEADKNAVRLYTYGAAEGVLTQDAVDYMTSRAPELAAEHGVFGVLYGGVSYLTRAMEALDEVPESEGSSETARVGEGSSLPPWYPESTENFVFYHDESAKRVVDTADIFTDAEEQQMEQRIGELRALLQRDIVVYTDVTDYNLGQDICAADFYDFNGYGYGDEYEGICLFIDMDPYDRGWWACATGSESRSLYTEDVANQLDDALYEYMASDAYAAGVADWIENVGTMFRTGAPFAPEWYPNAGETITRFHDANAPRVVDELGVLSEAEVASLTQQAAAISQKYGVDVAVHTMRAPVGMVYAEVGKLYYDHMGYGFGENYDGIILNVFKRSGYYPTARIAAFGSAAEKLSDVNEDRMRSACEDKLEDGKYAEALSGWLDQTGSMLRTGRVPRSAGYWAMIAAIGSAIGSIFGGISLGSAKSKMAAPKEQRDADAYIDRSSRISDAGRFYLYTTTSRRYDPPQTKSSGGGSSGRSSYSHSYSGSSGRSHSGSGRKF